MQADVNKTKELEEIRIQIKTIDDILVYGPRSEILCSYPLPQDEDGMDMLWRRFLKFIRDGLQDAAMEKELK